MPDSSAIKPFGLTQIYLPRGDPQVDIVFVHGLNGNPHDSWTSHKQTGCFWPLDLLPDILAPVRPRILTYGYNANVTAFTDGASRDTIVSHAETLASSLAANRSLRNCTERPIIFVCHSLGGLVVKRALIYSFNLRSVRTEHLRSIYVSTFGILFLGTPHNGSDIAKWGLLLHNICSAVLPKKFMESSPQLVQALRTNNETLQHINSLFADLMPRFHIYFFHETRSTDLRGTRDVIVDEASAAPYIEGVERMGIEADHSHMCKFEDENAPGYEAVAEALMRYSRQAPSVVADRWVEEKKTRALEHAATAREIFPGHSVATVPPPPASEGHYSPVQDMDNGGSLSFPTIPHEEPSLFIVPPGFHPNATFFGMKKELDVLHQRLYLAKSRAKRTKAVLISGVPGSGKTHLAREYVFNQRHCFPGGIFWIDSKTRESAYKCFWEIAQVAMLIDPEEARDPEYRESKSYVNAVRSWLQTREHWLLVFDGLTFDIDDDLNDFKQLLPWKEKCSIIYTSVDMTLRKKQRLFEPYCLQISKLKVEDACHLLFKDLGIKRPTAEQESKAKDLVNHYECLPLAIHAIGHRLNATGKPIEKFRIKSQVTDKKLAEPFLSIMNDLYRLQFVQALNLINLLSFLGHQVPVGMLNFGRPAMATSNVDILTKAQTGEDADLDTTLGTLIHYGLIERTTDLDPLSSQTTSIHQSIRYSGTEYSNGNTSNGDDTAKPTVQEVSESFTESSQEGFFSIYRGDSAVDVVKIHSVVQGFCRDELRIKDEEYKGGMNKNDPGFYDSWLIVTARFLCKSYEGAKEKMAHYHDCGLVRDYREYETHASRLTELFPKKSPGASYPPVLREARENLRQLVKSISNEIDVNSPSSSHQAVRNQRSVFDRSSSSSSSIPDSSSADEGLSRKSTFNWNELGSPRAESPEEMAVPPPRFRLELFPPHIFRQAGYESEDGYETDQETKPPPKISPSLSQASQTTERAKQSPSSSSPPVPLDEGEWKVIKRHERARTFKERQQERQQERHQERQPRRRARDPRRPRGTKLVTPLVKVSSVHGRGSSSRTPVLSENGGNSTVLASAAEQALDAVRRRLSSSQLTSDTPGSSATTPKPVQKENTPTYATVAARRMLEGELLVRRPASVPAAHGLQTQPGLQMQPSAESLNSNPFASPLSHEVTSYELEGHDGAMDRSTYSEPGYYDLHKYPLAGLDLHTAPGSRLNSRRGSLAPVEAIRDLSASVPSLLPYPPPLPYEEDIAVSMPTHRRQLQQLQQVPMSGASSATTIVPIPHPSAIMPGAAPLSTSSNSIGNIPERPAPEPLARAGSGYSHQSWATEPVRYPPRFSPQPSSFGVSSDSIPSTASSAPQHQLLSGTGGWAAEYPLVGGSALQSDIAFPTHQPPLIPRLGSVDERLKSVDLGWNPDMEPAQLLQFGGHRVDVRDARHRLMEQGRLQTPRHAPTYRLYHPNLSGPLVQSGEHLHAPAPALEVHGRRARSGSSPPRPDYEGLGVRF
ncbi:hypothetical protein N7510_011133 [Penicillium lagena]|uniref:uncharacterized protein n=1 Tax=Penicillium lagena TaxID=94218 RepID=UPI0025419576|nr:uncharacterized protein N7510_011133 [Penicillium lagena]KAJ5601599.1 hypothetical protein N7510_011133 [Penicillium lagena]